METHARYATIGLFSVAVIAGAFLFVYWIRGLGGVERVGYGIRFEGPVAGLVTGSPVLFNGVRVGEVTGVRLDDQDPNRTTVLASVTRTRPDPDRQPRRCRDARAPRRAGAVVERRVGPAAA